MVEVGVLAAVAMLLALVLLMGYTGKALGQMRHECHNLMLQEQRLSQELEKEEILLESIVARRDNAQHEIENYTSQMEELASRAKMLEEELGRSRPQD